MSTLKFLNRCEHVETDCAAEETDELDKPPNNYKVTYYDLLELGFCIAVHFGGAGYGFYLIYTYFITADYTYFYWTLGFTLLPSIIVTLISVQMYIDDSRDKSYKNQALVRIVLCFLGIGFQLAPVIRFFDSIFYALKSLNARLNQNKKEQEKFFMKKLNEDSDVALLRVFSCYIQDAPQQVLQISLLLIDQSQGSTLYLIEQCVMIIVHFVTMGRCMATYHKCIRYDQRDKKNISFVGGIFVFFWHIMVTVSRILALSAIVSINPSWALISVIAHWCLMAIQVAVTKKSTFCGSNLLLDIFFSLAMGLVYIFNFVNLREGPTRKSYLMFYGLCFVENIVCSVIWVNYSFIPVENWLFHIFAYLPILTFFIGMGCLGIYYKFLHPNKKN